VSPLHLFAGTGWVIFISASAYRKWSTSERRFADTNRPISHPHHAREDLPHAFLRLFRNGSVDMFTLLQK